jgi:hypothetical protein
LGHRSVVTTQTYLHALAELEMVTGVARAGYDFATRMALVMEAHLRLESCAGFRCRRPAARGLRGP